MNDIAIYEAMTGTEEQIRIVWRKMRQSIKGVAIDGYRHRGREGRMSIKGIPMGVMMIRHGQLY
jgi:hypothetical protein